MKDARHKTACIYLILFIFLKKYFIYLFMKDTQRERERGRNTGRGRSRLQAGSSMTWDSILGLQDQALGCRRR